MFPLAHTKNDLYLEGFHSVYYFEFGKDHSHPPEIHDFWEMVYVDKGEIITIGEGVKCNLREGQAIFHKPGELHAHISNGEVANNMLVVCFSCNSNCMSFFENKTFTLDKTSKTLLSLFMQEAQKALGKIKNDYYDKGGLDFSDEKFGSAQLMEFHFIELLIKLIRTGDSLLDKTQPISGSRSITKNTLIELIISYLEKNIYNKITLNDICDIFFIRKSQLSVIFKEYTGKSPMQYYSELKIEEAKKLLRENVLSVSEITDKLNYSGIHSFSRAFKASTGFSPTGYKKSITLLQDSKTN